MDTLLCQIQDLVQVTHHDTNVWEVHSAFLKSEKVFQSNEVMILVSCASAGKDFGNSNREVKSTHDIRIYPDGTKEKTMLT